MTRSKIVQILLHEGQGGAESLAWSLHKVWDNSPRVSSTVVSLQACGWPSSNKLIVLRQLRKRLADLKPDAVFMHSALPSVYGRLVAYSMPRHMRWFSVLHSASDDFNDTRLRAAELLLRRRTSGVVAVSPANAADYSRKFGNAGVVVVPNGVDLAVFNEQGRRSSAASTFLATCRLHPQKDLETLVRGFALFAAGRDDVRLLIAGSPVDHAYAQMIAELIDDLIPGRIELLGARDDVASLLSQADVFVHSALREAHPISIIEAAVCGVPIVATKIAGVEDVVGDRAVLFTPGDAGALAEGLGRVVDDLSASRVRAHSLSKAARNLYSLRRTADAYEALALGSPTAPQ